MTKLKNFEIPTDVKLSKNDEDNEFMNSFLYHNMEYFKQCLSSGLKKIKMIGTNPKYPITKGNDENVGIHYETGKWKWGSVGMMNKMIRRGHITIAKDHNNGCYCLNATAKLVNRILSNIYRTIENIKCVEEKRYDDRNFSICK